ncbi:MAG: NRDE family protein [Alphaproteobacteria bacterium]|jgi:hypothetical protein|nr:NRDE family protein [Alphaproteobacteria bacterium]MDP6516121.1 NRDE family protein [Alphaproteobacteria bacterium]
MCTLVILRRPESPWPVLIAANRDEMLAREWAEPARHWPDRGEVVAGLDAQAGGSWLGINDDGMVAAVLNRTGELGSAADKRSRGELVLEALDHADADGAAAALVDLDGGAYRSFNLVVADNRSAVWLRHTGGRRIESRPLPVGLSMLTAHDLDDPASPRVRRYLPRFRAAPVPDPAAGDWGSWIALLSARGFDAADGPNGAMTITTDTGFGTSSSSLIALPAIGAADIGSVWLFAAARPDQAPFVPVALEPKAALTPP